MARRVALALILMLLACDEDAGSEVIVGIKSDLVPGIEFTSIDVRLARASGTSVTGSAPLEILREMRIAVEGLTTDALLEGTSVGRFDDVEPGSYWVLTRLLDSTGRIVVERPTIIDVPDSTFGFVVLLTRDCRGVSCPAPGGGASLLACLAGDCIDPRCHPEAPEFCPPPECANDGECMGGSSCAPARCSAEGICLLGADGAMCGGGEYCSPDLGCLPVPMPMDADVPDAGPVVCGTICFPPDRPCFAGYYECSSGAPTCDDLVQIAEGTSCGPGMECDAAGECVATGCTPGGRCWTGCVEGTIECVGDVRSCALGAANVAEGTPCEPAATCYDGEACGGFLACDALGVCTSPGPTRILGMGGVEGDGYSRFPRIAADGSAVTFEATAGNLVPGDTNGVGDVFVYDFATMTLDRVSVATDGTEGDDWSSEPRISADGRYVLFHSGSTTLVAGEMNTRNKVYLHDRMMGTTERVSITTAGTEPFSPSTAQDITPDGRFILFESSSNEFALDDTNTTFDGFVYDRMMGTTVRMTLDTGGVEREDGGEPFFLSADGSEVYFESRAELPDMSNGAYLYAYDRTTMTQTRLSETMAGEDLDRSAVSGWATRDGRFVAYSTRATNLLPGSLMQLQIYLLDRMTGVVERLSVNDAGEAGDGYSELASCSEDGNRCVFFSTSENLVPDDTNGTLDIFVRDRAAGTTVRVSEGPAMVEGDGGCSYPTITADGNLVCFESAATNLAAGDTNGQIDVFCVPVP